MASIYTEIDRVMAMLTRIAPAKRFDRNSGQIVRSSWQRGGTSPAGNEMNATHNRPDLANYFVGAKYQKTDLAAPQRIVWMPPGPGQERLGPPDKLGWTADEVVAGALPRAYRAIATRLSPWTVEMWARDHDDAIELGNWLMAAYHMVNAGRTILGGQLNPVDSLGWVPDESLQDGVKWQCVLWFAWPVVVPYLATREMEGDATRIDVVTEIPDRPASNNVGTE